ncbi:MAG TPA: hypothetical protein VM735_01905 [Candidatus Kapabacteria bacterium]|nr:hypothetical protein [Candidatus Kapabacteria bacterium]
MNQFAGDVSAYSRYAAEFDAPIRCELLYGDTHGAIGQIAGKYRLARCFPRRFDVDLGLPRYGPIVSALQAYQPDGSSDPVLAVLDLSRDLQRCYHKGALSAASKFLWFLWGREVLIYDRQAFTTLQRRFPALPPRDYHSYCSAWVAYFTECAESISTECNRQGFSVERPFLERVFDWHLWRSGK